MPARPAYPIAVKAVALTEKGGVFMLSTSISYLVGALAAPLLLLTALTIPAQADEPPTAASVADQSSGQEKLFYRRYLQVENSTNEPLRVYVRYRTLTDK